MHDHRDLTIGALAAAAECSVPTIRYYEQIGLLPAAARRAGGHRVYDGGDIQRLTFIRRCRDFGFPIDQVRQMVSLAAAPERDCSEARDLAAARLNEVRKKLKDLRALERSLKTYVDDCTERCAGGPAGSCVIIEDLGSAKSGCCGSSRA